MYTYYTERNDLASIPILDLGLSQHAVDQLRSAGIENVEEILDVLKLVGYAVIDARPEYLNALFLEVVPRLEELEYVKRKQIP